MGSLTTLLYSSLSALQAEQAALDATSKNVANQNTVGYTREVVQFQATDSVTLSTSVGTGVSDGAGPVSLRDRVLEQRVQQQTQSQSQSAAVESALKQVQSVFNLSSTSTSASTTALGSAIDKLLSSFSSLANNPADTATRQNVLNAADSLAAQFNSAASQFAQITGSLNQQTVATVDQVNGLTSTIAKLNSQITNLSPNADAGSLEDQRQSALAKLSQLIGVDQIRTENNGITLTTTGGQVLVGGSVSEPLATTQVNGNTHIVAGSGGQDITSQIAGGQLGGILQARDAVLPGITNSLDVLAGAIATQVNQVNAQGVDGHGNAGKVLFTVSATVAGAAASIAVATTDPLSVAAAAVGEGSAGNSNAQALADISTANIAGGTTAVSFYASLLDTIGNTTATATAENTQQQASLTQLTTQRDSLSGVSLDQEAANLTQYQRSYEAAARVFSIVDTLLASAINLGQGATVS